MLVMTSRKTVPSKLIPLSVACATTSRVSHVSLGCDKHDSRLVMRRRFSSTKLCGLSSPSGAYSIFVSSITSSINSSSSIGDTSTIFGRTSTPAVFPPIIPLRLLSPPPPSNLALVLPASNNPAAPAAKAFRTPLLRYPASLPASVCISLRNSHVASVTDPKALLTLRSIPSLSRFNTVCFRALYARRCRSASFDVPAGAKDRTPRRALVYEDEEASVNSLPESISRIASVTCRISSAGVVNSSYNSL
mmetsp:Transcript_6522/g.14757  ORF Transcript_6522/g.14757 Transcript_6522/m.14757 type:complete len:248 (-) Transcript_6522:1289-2032(-)